jgi:hypothetical protein
VHLLNGNQFKNKQLSATMGGDKTKTNRSKTLLGASKTSKYADFTHEEIDPPICINLPLCGHSFGPGSQPFIPMVKISQHNLDFKPCGPFESVYQILQDSTQTFNAFPSLGLIPGKSFALVTYEFSPKTARFFNFASQIIFNNSSANL